MLLLPDYFYRTRKSKKSTIQSLKNIPDKILSPENIIILEFLEFFLELSYTEKVTEASKRCEGIIIYENYFYETCSKNVKFSTTAQNVSGSLGNFLHSYTIFMTVQIQISVIKFLAETL